MWYYNTTYLCHHGILGQKWGRRRFQNEDGSLTAEGKQRYGSGDGEKKSGAKSDHKKLKTALKVGAVVAGTALAAYGGYKLSEHIKTKAGSDILRNGEEMARRLTNQADFHHGGTLNPWQGSFHRAKENEYRIQSAKVLTDSTAAAKETSKSLKSSIKYLRENKKNPNEFLNKSSYNNAELDNAYKNLRNQYGKMLNKDLFRSQGHENDFKSDVQYIRDAKAIQERRNEIKNAYAIAQAKKASRRKGVREMSQNALKKRENTLLKKYLKD
ncbi:MAG: hypothetical protein J6U54_09580 [Clostridiales bacterium]|nr:hypothetical protein [Clostridiales bacterium]